MTDQLVRPKLIDCKTKPWYLVLYSYEEYLQYLEALIKDAAEMVSYLRKRLATEK